MDVNQQLNENPLDWNKIIAEVIVKNEEKFVGSLTGAIETKYKRAKVKFGNAFERYLKNAFEKYSKVKTLLYRNAPRFLYEFYEFNDIRCDGEVVECDHVEEVLKTSRFSVVEGDGGSGKSMLMRHFFINALQESDIIPVFIELRSMEKDDTLDKYIYKTIKALGFNLDEAYFLYALKQGMFLFLLDGYDEMKAEVKDSFFWKIDDFCDMYCENYFVISSRRNGAFVGWQRFSIFEIMPLSKKRALNLIQKLDYDVEIKEKFCDKLSNELYKTHQSFASNPLLLSIMLITFDQYAEIPEKLHVFYASAFDAMYSMHDATKGGYTRERKSKLTSDQFKQIFSTFCFRTYIKGMFEFTEDVILNKISEAGKSIAGFDAASFLEDLKIAVCLLYKEGEDYLFTHRSFQEYFTACFLNALDDGKQAKACRALLRISGQNIQSDNVFAMLKDMGEERFEKNYIVPVLEEIDQSCPAVKDPIQKYFFGTVQYCFISTDLQKIFVENECDRAYILSGDGFTSENSLLLGVKFVSEEVETFVMSTVRFYEKYEELQKKKIETKYWERRYAPEEIWKDAVLKQYFVQQTRLGKDIKIISSLLDQLKSRQCSGEDDFQKILDELNEMTLD